MVLWRGFGTEAMPGAVSISELIEANAEALKKYFLAWIYDIGMSYIKGRRLVEHLELRPGFSYWWMTLLTEKCNFAKSPQIDDAIRAIAFDNWAKSRAVDQVVLVSESWSLAQCIRLWCASSGAAFEWQRIVKPAASTSWPRRIYKAFPHTLQALIWLPRYLIDRWPLRGVGLDDWRQSDGCVTFFSYLFNLVPDAAKQGRYESRYWAHLPDALQRRTCKTNWLHLYVKDGLLPTSTQAVSMLHSFNKTAQGAQQHVTLDTFLSYGVVFRTLRDWFRLRRISSGLRNQVCIGQKGVLNLWPLFENDWRQSIYGSVAMSNILYLNLLEAALKCLPRQQCGVYLQENQGWEIGLIQAWHATGHGRLIGAPHSTVRFWDLRYFFDPRSYARTGCHKLPVPTQVAVNGPAVRDAYKNGAYPVEDLVEVEALRYLHLNKVRVKTCSANKSKKGEMRLLVLGDYLIGNTQRQMNLLIQAASLLPVAMVITVKPHPACPIYVDDYPSLKMTLATEPIERLLAECDVAYSSAVTSAAVDAYCAGVPIVSVLDPNTLNLSPLRGCAGALFASTPEELATALMSAGSTSSTPRDQQAFFTIDPQLPRWQKLLIELSDSSSYSTEHQ